MGNKRITQNECPLTRPVMDNVPQYLNSPVPIKDTVDDTDYLISNLQ